MLVAWSNTGKLLWERQNCQVIPSCGSRLAQLPPADNRIIARQVLQETGLTGTYPTKARPVTSYHFNSFSRRTNAVKQHMSAFCAINPKRLQGPPSRPPFDPEDGICSVYIVLHELLSFDGGILGSNKLFLPSGPHLVLQPSGLHDGPALSQSRKPLKGLSARTSRHIDVALGSRYDAPAPNSRAFPRCGNAGRSADTSCLMGCTSLVAGCQWREVTSCSSSHCERMCGARAEVDYMASNGREVIRCRTTHQPQIHGSGP